VIGKDITRFHCIYWPAMLLAAGVELPKQVHVHGFLQYRGQRLSKTTGNMIDPFAASKEWGADALRYLLLRHVGFTDDVDVSPEIFTARYNADLANNLGNLVQRTVAMIGRYREGRIPPPARGGASELRDMAERAVRAHDEAAARLAFDEALAAIFALVDATNLHYDQTKPWALAKSGTADELDDALYSAAEAVRLVAHLLWPYAPQAATKIATALNATTPGPGSAEQWARESSWGRLLPGNPLRPSAPLFPRIETGEKVAT
jgi:methionyl-tRNA synthetase